jgi:hypothetical protein
MYQVLGVPTLLRFYGMLVALLAFGLASNLWGFAPQLADLHLNLISATVLAATGFVALIGGTGFFAVLCRCAGLWRIFPDIGGEYSVEISSNWNLIQDRTLSDTEDSVARAPFVKTGTLSIKADLFRVQLALKMDDGYLTSDTVACSMVPSGGGGRPSLYYVFRSEVAAPAQTDSNTHFGAARIPIPVGKMPAILEGDYWTNRNWHRGLNTAGRIRLTRVS